MERKRKRTEDGTEGTPKKPSQTTSSGNVRSLLLSLKSGSLSTSPLVDRLQSLQGHVFPGKDEWVLTYLLNLLSTNPTGISILDINVAWRMLNDVVRSVDPQILARLLRKFDFVWMIHGYLSNAATIVESAALSSINDLLKYFMTHRCSRKILMTTLDRSYGTLLAAIKIHGVDQAAKSETSALLVNITLTVMKLRSTPKKLQELITGGDSIPLMSSVGSIEDLNILRPLFHQCVFSDIITFEPKTIIKASKADLDMMQLEICRWSFDAINSQVPSSSKNLDTRNSLLLRWLDVVDTKSKSLVLTQYSCSRKDSTISRPLSGDLKVKAAIERHIAQVLENAEEEAELLIGIVLNIDVDLLLPTYESQLWTSITANTSRSLLQRALLAYIEIRALPQFINHVIQSDDSIADILDFDIMSIMSLEVRKCSESVQQSLLNSAYAGRPKVKPLLLAALLGGLMNGTKIIDQNLVRLVASCTKNDSLLKMMIVSRLSQQQSKHHEIMKLNISAATILNQFDAEAWLRYRELCGTEDVQNSSERIDEILGICTSSQPLITTLVQRYFLVFSALSSDAQKAQLFDIIETTSQAEWITKLYTDPVILENDAVQSLLQTRLIGSDSRVISQVLTLVPVEFFHKAMRHKLVNNIAEKDTRGAADLAVLLKYARAGIFVKIQSSDAYSKIFTMHNIADNSQDLHEGELILTQVRRLYAQHLDQDLVREIIHDSQCPLQLRVELLDMLTDLQLADLQLIDGINDLASNIGDEDIDETHQILNLYLQMFRSIYRQPDLSKIDVLWLKLQEGSILSNLEKVTNQCATSHSTQAALAQVIELQAWLCSEASQSMALLSRSNDLSGMNLPIAAVKAVSTAITHKLGTDEMPLLTTMLSKDLSTSLHSGMNIRWSVALLSSSLEHTTGTHEIRAYHWYLDTFQHICSNLKTLDLTDPSLHVVIDEVLDFTSTIVEQHTRLLEVRHLDTVFVAIVAISRNVARQETQLLMHQALRSIFEHHGHLIRDRYHLVVNIFQNLLSRCTTNAISTSLVRLFGTFLTCLRTITSTPEIFNKAFSKHVPWLVIEYIHLITKDTSVLAPDSKRIIEEGLIYPALELCSSHEREMMGASLDSSGRGVFKRLYDEWTKFGKWTDK